MKLIPGKLYRMKRSWHFANFIDPNPARANFSDPNTRVKKGDILMFVKSVSKGAEGEEVFCSRFLMKNGILLDSPILTEKYLRTDHFIEEA